MKSNGSSQLTQVSPVPFPLRLSPLPQFPLLRHQAEALDLLAAAALGRLGHADLQLPLDVQQLHLVLVVLHHLVHSGHQSLWMQGVWGGRGEGGGGGGGLIRVLL